MKSQRGFSLIELAIVMVIITILIGGLAVPLSAQIQARRIAETNKTLEEARMALIGYAMTHKSTNSTPYLPCPSGKDVNGKFTGLEETRVGGKCPDQYGWLPWVTLGTGGQDAWGNRLAYATNTDVSNSNEGIYDSLYNNSAPPAYWNQICSSHTCATGDIAQNIPAVIVSMGPNGWGALNVNGGTLSAPTGADELENLNGDNRFVSRSSTKPGDPSGEFDDLLTWIPYTVLYASVCPTGGGCVPTIPP